MFRVKNAVLGFALAGIASLTMADAGGGMISAWVFDDGTANDVNGVNNGIIHGGAGFAAGVVGDAIDLDGVDDYVEVPNDASMNSMATSFTASAWVFVRGAGDHAGIVWKGEMIGWGENFLFRIATTSDVNLTWGATIPGTEGWFATDDAYVSGEWTHVAITADGTNVSAYVNGEMPVGTGGGDNPREVVGPYNLWESQPIRIGLGVGRGGDLANLDYLDASIDEVSIWSRALSQAEIKDKLISGSVDVEAKGKATTTWGSLKTR